MKAYSVILFMVCLNIAAFIFQQSGAISGSRELYISPFDIKNQFSLDTLLLTLTGVGVIGVLGVLLGQGRWTIGALLAWVIFQLVPIGNWIISGVPYLLLAILPAELSYLTYVVEAFFAIIFFIFILEIAGQRYIT